MPYGKDDTPGAQSAVADDIDDEQMPPNLDDLIPDFEDEALEQAAQGTPMKAGAHTVKVLRPTVKLTSDKSKNPGRPYITVPLKSLDQPEADSLFLPLAWPWKKVDSEGDVVLDENGEQTVVKTWCQDGQEWVKGTGIKYRKRPVREFADEVTDLEFRIEVAHKKEDNGNYRDARGNEFSVRLKRFL